MNSSLPITADPINAHIQPFDEERWDAWVAKGRLAHTAFVEKVKMLAMLGVTVGVVAGTLWIFLG